MGWFDVGCLALGGSALYWFYREQKLFEQFFYFADLEDRTVETESVPEFQTAFEQREDQTMPLSEDDLKEIHPRVAEPTLAERTALLNLRNALKKPRAKGRGNHSGLSAPLPPRNPAKKPAIMDRTVLQTCKLDHPTLKGEHSVDNQETEADDGPFSHHAIAS